MPLFIHNENEIYNEDDGPLPANTPSTGSMGSRGLRVVACGNRVLEIIEKHKAEVQYVNYITLDELAQVQIIIIIIIIFNPVRI